MLTLGATVKVPTPVEPTDATPKSYVDAIVASGVSDGDKGEIVVSGGGAVWSIDSGAVTTAKLADNSVTAAKISATGTASSITYLRGDGSWATVPSGGITDGDKGDITVSGSGAAWSIDNGVVTTAKLADSSVTTAKLANASVTPAKISATGTAGNTTYLRGDGAWATVPSGGGITDGDKGEITVSGSGTVWSIDNGVVTTAKLADNSVTAAKISATGTASNTTYLRGDGSWATVPSGGGITDGDKGEITVSGSGAVWSIDNGVVTTAKLADSSVTAAKISATGTASNTTYLRGDGSWATVPSGGEGGSLSPAQIRDSLATLAGNDRLDASAIKNLPTGGSSFQDFISGLMEIPAIKTYALDYFVLRAYRLTQINLATKTGTATISIELNGVNVPGLASLPVTSAGLTAVATSGNLAAIGSKIDFVVSNASAPTDLAFTLGFEYA